MSRTTSNILIFSLVAGSVISGLYDAAFFWFDVQPERQLGAFWHLAFVLILVTWLERDSRGRADIQRPFDFGFLAFVYWIPYVPYYLWRTRRGMGLVISAALVTLFFFSQLLMLGIYLAR